jgi:hypothetical protein
VPQVNITGHEYNEEDVSSRYYRTVRFGQISGGFNLSLGDIAIPVLSFSIPKVITVGAYINPSFNLQVYGGIVKKKLSNENDFVTTSYDLGGTISGSVEIGAKVNVLPGIDPTTLKIDAKGYGGCTIGGDIRYKIQNGNDLVQLIFYADPLKVGFRTEISIAGIKFIDVRYEENYGDRVQISQEW